jgi:uncharacterized protein (TIGR03118 family)
MHDDPLKPGRVSRVSARAALCTLSLLLAPAVASVADAFDFGRLGERLDMAFANFENEHRGVYVQTNLVSDGMVAAAHTDPKLIRRFARGGRLNLPWAVTLAPANFGAFSNHILVSNFGNGTIAAFDVETGEFDGLLRNANAEPIVIQGLWDVEFGNGLLNQPTNTLFFSSGPGNGAHGLYGSLAAKAAGN